MCITLTWEACELKFDLPSQNLFGWIFMPLAWVMGVKWAECDLVGELIGLKITVNEFVAYSKLAEMRENGLLSVGASRPRLTFLF